jgi:hypothetical protein
MRSDCQQNETIINLLQWVNAEGTDNEFEPEIVKMAQIQKDIENETLAFLDEFSGDAVYEIAGSEIVYI